jgi:hypothetical protein
MAGEGSDMAETQRYARIAGDYHFDREAVPLWAWIVGLFALVIPPVGAAILGFCAMQSITTKTNNNGNQHAGDIHARD